MDRMPVHERDDERPSERGRLDRTNRVLDQLTRLIGRQRRAKETLRVELDKLESGSEKTAIIYSRLPPDYSSLAFITEDVVSVLGFSPEEWTRNGFWSAALHPGDAFETLVDLARSKEEAAVRARSVREYRLLHKNGTWRWIRDESRVVVDKSGKLSQIFGLWTDITERRRMEDELTAATNDLTKAVGECPIMIVLAPLGSGLPTEVNKTFQRITGYSEREVVARFPSDLWQWVDGRDLGEAIERMTAERKLQNMGVRFRTKEGATLTGVLSAETVGQAGDSYLVAVVGDIKAYPSSSSVPARPGRWREQNNRHEASSRIRLLRGGACQVTKKESRG